jgi:hypothetical protein
MDNRRSFMLTQQQSTELLEQFTQNAGPVLDKMAARLISIAPNHANQDLSRQVRTHGRFLVSQLGLRTKYATFAFAATMTAPVQSLSQKLLCKATDTCEQRAENMADYLRGLFGPQQTQTLLPGELKTLEALKYVQERGRQALADVIQASLVQNVAHEPKLLEYDYSC